MVGLNYLFFSHFSIAVLFVFVCFDVLISAVIFRVLLLLGAFHPLLHLFHSFPHFLEVIPLIGIALGLLVPIIFAEYLPILSLFK